MPSRNDRPEDNKRVYCCAEFGRPQIRLTSSARCRRGGRPAAALVSRLENEAVLGRMATRLKARPEILARRRETVEHPFGTIKQWMNQGAFLMKGHPSRGAYSSLM